MVALENAIFSNFRGVQITGVSWNLGTNLLKSISSHGFSTYVGPNLPIPQNFWN